MRNALTHECALLHRYLLGSAPSSYVVEKYATAHEHLPQLACTTSWFDGFLLSASRVHPVFLRLIQAYVRIFLPGALVRKKAVLLLAIVECCAPSLVSIQAARRRRPAVAILMSALTVSGFALELLLAAIIFAPIQLVSSMVARTGRTLPLSARAVREPA